MVQTRKMHEENAHPVTCPLLERINLIVKKCIFYTLKDEQDYLKHQFLFFFWGGEEGSD